VKGEKLNLQDLFTEIRSEVQRPPSTDNIDTEESSRPKPSKEDKEELSDLE